MAREDFAQSLQAAMEEAGDGGGGFIELQADVGQRKALQMVEDDGLALSLWQARQGIGQPEQLFRSDGLLAGR